MCCCTHYNGSCGGADLYIFKKGMVMQHQAGGLGTSTFDAWKFPKENPVGQCTGPSGTPIIHENVKKHPGAHSLVFGPMFNDKIGNLLQKD
jgi:hypothetical protein